MSTDLANIKYGFDNLTYKQAQEIAQYATYVIAMHLQERAYPCEYLKDNPDYMYWSMAFENILEMLKGHSLSDIQEQKSRKDD